MSATVEKKIYTAEERAEFLAKREEFRSKIKQLEAIQKDQKALLRKDHHEIPETVIGSYGSKWSGTAAASRLMGETWYRRKKISDLLISYKSFLGKPFDMHEKKLK